MPAVVKCPNGCKLRVPARKLFDSFQCPKCQSTIFVSKDQVEKYRADQEHTLLGNFSSDLVEVVSDEIVFLDGEAGELLIEITDELENAKSIAAEKAPVSSNPNETPPIVPPPVVQDHPPNQNDIVFADTESFTQKNTTAELRSNDSTTLETADLNTADVDPKKLRMDLPLPVQKPVHAQESLQAVDQKITNEASAIDELEKKLHAEQTRRETSAEKGVKAIAAWFDDKSNPGVLHNKDNCWKAYSLSWAMVIIGIFLLGPVIYTMLEWMGKDYHLPLGRWSFLLIFFSSMQFLYALYLSQIPDWTTTRFVSYFMLAMTVFSSFLLAISMLSQGGNSFFTFIQLSVVEKGKVSSWLFVMSITFGLMSYLCGRTTQLWIKEETRRSVTV